VRIPHRLCPPWHSCLVGAWRSVGSLPPDVAVWGRPSYVLPVWRNVITSTTEMILTEPVERPIPAIPKKNHPSRGPRNVRLHQNSDPGLEIPMAVTYATYGKPTTALGERIITDRLRRSETFGIGVSPGTCSNRARPTFLGIGSRKRWASLNETAISAFSLPQHNWSPKIAPYWSARPSLQFIRKGRSIGVPL
jgi:hypothetical protein